MDGTLSGKTQSVLVSEETVSDDLTLTVWEIKANEDGNLVERITEFDEDGEVAATEADKTIEKKIQYIIRIEPTQTGIITTKGTTQYEGYNVAHEGDTVTLKVNVPEGYSLKNAFNGTDTKVQLLQDENGEYYLVVPRGGAVMLSVELEKIPDPDPQPQPQPAGQPAAQTTPKAAVKAAQDTAATTELKKDIEEAFKKNDFLSILPQEIKGSVQGVTALVEAVTLSLENYDPAMGAITVTAKTTRKFTKGETAKVLIALPNADGTYTYFYITGEGQADGTLALNLTADTAKALAGKTFVTLILE